MSPIAAESGALVLNRLSETLRVEAWGPHAVRVRAGRSPAAVEQELPGALDLPPAPTEAEAVLDEHGGGRLVNGRITVEVDASGRVRFLRTGTGRELLAEKKAYSFTPGPRIVAPAEAGTRSVEQHFEAYEGERLYGLGQQLHGRLDQKGCVVELVQRNTVVSIPFLHSSRGYGLLWNNPALGRVELGADATRWVADSARRIDYWVTAGDSPAEIAAAYAEATGPAPELPAWASGFWQSKLRYRDQEELLGVAREHRGRGLPMSVIVCDFFHWPRMGDWRFDAGAWPDPAAMVAELAELGVRLAVSVWPTVDPDSESFGELRESRHLVRDVRGGLLTHEWPVEGSEKAPCAYVDSTDPGARAAMWARIRRNYADKGVAAFWLDANEPVGPPWLGRRALYAAGTGEEVGNIYGALHNRAFAEGQREAGVERPLSLVRSTWAGGQRDGIALWSGDVAPTFESFAVQVTAGLNVAMSGIPWWHTDIGGFSGGDPADPAYRELLVRWFQYGTFSPVMRLHGDRVPHHGSFSTEMSGGPNEVWSYGEEAYGILTEHLALRERLRPYLAELSTAAHRTGAPPMRPLFFDFPGDERAWTVADQFMLGPDLLVAPVTEAGARERAVYLPSGTRWLDVRAGAVHEGGAEVDAKAPLRHIPVFAREGAAVSEKVAG
ncbi:TIM-barrel domain-containing protein [Phytomonospora sp. NPDC050363]|uniref:glycoside hydrolase family 31 protein n=1 Tax=Phytomonospora sp. NPDC050363 TaxID=3155642 RepID=UPI0033E5C9E8